MSNPDDDTDVPSGFKDDAEMERTPSRTSEIIPPSAPTLAATGAGVTPAKNCSSSALTSRMRARTHLSATLSARVLPSPRFPHVVLSP